MKAFMTPDAPYRIAARTCKTHRRMFIACLLPVSASARAGGFSPARDKTYEGNGRVRRLMPTATRPEAAGHALDEAEEFQAVGMKLRECLLTLVHTLSKPEYVPAGQEAPKRSDFIHWAELIADAVAPGPRAQETRAYLKAVTKTTWQLVNWLTHSANAVLQDARLAHQAAENLFAAFWTAVEKHESGAPDRCPSCGSYRILTDYRPDLGIDPPYILLCERCDWVAPKQVPPHAAQAAMPAEELGVQVRRRATKKIPKPK
jgi:hypothetical protein